MRLDFLWASVITAVSLITSFDSEVYKAVWTSLFTSAWATLFASTIGIPFGVAVTARRFPLKRVAIVVLNTLMALPTVVVGLVVYGFISRQGPLGGLGLLFTPMAMIVGQTILALPIVSNYTIGAIKGADNRIIPTALTLGASNFQAYFLLLSETRFGIVAAIVAGFGRVIGEVGVAMMLGGNIRGYTRTMTTAIALETSKGEFAFGLALGMILMTVALLINIFLNLLQHK